MRPFDLRGEARLRKDFPFGVGGRDSLKKPQKERNPSWATLSHEGTTVGCPWPGTVTQSGDLVLTGRILPAPATFRGRQRRECSRMSLMVQA